MYITKLSLTTRSPPIPALPPPCFLVASLPFGIGTLDTSPLLLRRGGVFLRPHRAPLEENLVAPKDHQAIWG